MADSSPPFRLDPAPIVEAIVDVHCELSPTLNKGAFQSAAQKVFADRYPEFRTQLVQEQRFSVAAGKPPKVEVPRQSVRGFQTLSRDKKQIVQSRFDGFSFNRLAPYSTLDDYLPEIQRCWSLYCGFANVIVVRRIALRFINRVLLPLANGAVDLDKYLRMGAVVPPGAEPKLGLTAFTHHHQFTEIGTGNVANVVLAAQPPQPDGLPVILDIEAFRAVSLPPADWVSFLTIIATLRALKNQLFRYNLKDTCLSFSP